VYNFKGHVEMGSLTLLSSWNPCAPLGPPVYSV